MTKWFRKDLEGYTPYNAYVPPHSVKLDANESPYSLSERVKEEFMEWFSSEERLNVYPDSDSTELRRALGDFWDVFPGNIICGVGSDQIIDYIAKAFIEPGDLCLLHKPTFSMYSIAIAQSRGKIMEIESKDGFSIPIRDIMNVVEREKPKIIFICSPNNPTGNSFSKDDIKKLVLSVGALVVVDEAYCEFSGESVIDMTEKCHNLIVLRTFSKAYGLAGARVGYAVAWENIIRDLNAVKAPYNLNVLSAKLAELALRDSYEYKSRVKILNENREELKWLLEQIDGLTVYPSQGNFLYVEADRDIAAALLDKGVLVRNFSKNGQYAVRITCGTKKQNIKLCSIIREVYKTSVGEIDEGGDDNGEKSFD